MKQRSVAIITPSYVADFERCRLLCDSIDANVSGIAAHYILVDNDDYPVFSELQGARRHVINEREILPSWLRVMGGGTSSHGRKLWLSTRTWPMRGWHVQQLRRIAIAAHIDDDALLYCDSDMFFVRPFDAATLWRNDALRLYRKPGGITAGMDEHRKWLKAARRLLALPDAGLPQDDYINNLVSWRRQAVLEMCAHIEAVTGRDWLSAIGRNRTFSECLIYGLYADEIAGEGAGHWHADQGLCLTYWEGGALDHKAFEAFIDQMADDQVAVGVQSFTETDPLMLRQLLERAA